MPVGRAGNSLHPEGGAARLPRRFKGNPDMKTILKQGVFIELCPLCGHDHCYASGGDRRRCPHREHNRRHTAFTTFDPVIQRQKRHEPHE